MLDIKTIRKDFAIFKNEPNLAYLDSSATSLKPSSVVEKLVEYYEKYSANVKRGIYKISEKATQEYEEARDVLARFIGAKNREEVIFTRGTTESINLVAYSLGREIVGRNDEIVTTIMEHHSNFVPWQQLAFENQARFKVIDITKDNRLNTDLSSVVTKTTKILALSYVSNTLGLVNPIQEIVKKARRINPSIIIVLDAAQAAPHMKIDVVDLGVDFLAFSGHKMLGPTGIGVLWGKKDLLRAMFPFQFGGEMIEYVKIEKTSFADIPEKFEAGTPAVAEAIALKEAVKYLQLHGLENIKKHERDLAEKLVKRLDEEFASKISFLLPADGPQSGIVSFVLKGAHPHDLASILSDDNICIRAGHHCTMPLHHRFGLSASCRVSFYLYNREEEIDRVVQGLAKAQKLFS